MKKTGEQIPIMSYVQELEGKVREAREEANRWKGVALMSMIKSIQFFAGLFIGGCVSIVWGVWGIVKWIWG
jgi:hypothetical protein